MVEKLIDPAAEKAKEREDKALDDKMKSFDIGRLSMEDFKAIPRGAAHVTNPFEGYPRRADVAISTVRKMVPVEKKVPKQVPMLDEDDKPVLYKTGEKTGQPRTKTEYDTVTVQEMQDVPVMVNPTYIIALNPTIYVHQDPSGKGISQFVNNVERHVDITTLHNRMVVDNPFGTGQNLDVVFGNKLELANGQSVMATVLPSHGGRAQIVFKLNETTGKVDVDERYLLLDGGQTNRLKRLFMLFHNQAIVKERLSAAISDEVDQADAEKTLMTTPATSVEE